ncbi:MAG: 50S ribosomal protein L6 [Candidatus Shapirobacteria bacterium]|nr:50S ribosomal protein L6 [Candidatus Shapirobacteria bacterium]
MSKVGKKPILLPEGTKVILDKNRVGVEGPKGLLSLDIPDSLKISQQDGFLIVERKNDGHEAKVFHGTIRQLLANMVEGVNREWVKKLQLIGTGYVVQMKGKNLNFSLGLSHQIDFPAPEGIRFEVDGDVVGVFGIDRQLVGRVAYQIRSLRPPDAYKGKGIRYFGEEIKLKPGKAAKVGEGGSE